MKQKGREEERKSDVQDIYEKRNVILMICV